MGGSSVTVLLRQWKGGDRAALDELVPIVYGELHRIAENHMRREGRDSLSPTELVAEAYERLAQADSPEWNDRVHFFAVAARHMRQILVDRARKRGAAKRGHGDRPVTFDEGEIDTDRPEEMIALDDALNDLAREDERKARVLEMHYFAGMTTDEIARALDVAASTVTRDLRFAIAWLNTQLSASETTPADQ